MRVEAEIKLDGELQRELRALSLRGSVHARVQHPAKIILLAAQSVPFCLPGCLGCLCIAVVVPRKSPDITRHTTQSPDSAHAPSRSTIHRAYPHGSGHPTLL